MVARRIEHDDLIASAPHPAGGCNCERLVASLQQAPYDEPTGVAGHTVLLQLRASYQYGSPVPPGPHVPKARRRWKLFVTGRTSPGRPYPQQYLKIRTRKTTAIPNAVSHETLPCLTT